MKFGLIGKSLPHSFSQAYFTERFSREGRAGFSYELFELAEVEDVMPLLHADMHGLNVTIPYKTTIISYLNQVDRVAFDVQAVNTLVRTGVYSWKGYNTDITGFRDSLLRWFGATPLPMYAMVMGTGGASKAVVYVLENLGLTVMQVSSRPTAAHTYDQLTLEDIAQHPLIINTTPLGMFPGTQTLPSIPYHALTKNHWLYDLVYNPPNTLFLARGNQAGARTKNGLEMLQLQADHAWAIWKMYGKF